jgi:hypothetical protein
MARTVSAAFHEFLREVVNLDREDTKRARCSRDWLRGQLHTFAREYSDFPVAWADMDSDFGSFARRTKIRPLDDIDMIHCLKGLGGSYIDRGSHVAIHPAAGTRLAAFCHADAESLSSTRVLNAFKKHLVKVPQYAAADVKRNGEAVTLELTSYSWKFDIVPGFFTAREYDGRDYYLIPDGSGHWMKTDPRLDALRVTTVNRNHAGHVLDVLRLMKFWNRRPTMPSVASYAFENLVLNYYEAQERKASQFVDLEVSDVLEHIAVAVYQCNFDPKGIQGDLNTMGVEDQRKISDRAAADARKARDARALESNNDHKGSIQKWSEVFGPTFPGYG